VASFHESLGRSVDGASADLVLQARLTRDLQRDLMRVRMVQFASISERLYHVTRQAAKEVDKRVNLDIRGSAVEIDRGVLEKMGMSPEALLAINPSLVIIRISGWGQDGPYAQRPGFGTVIEGVSGFAAINGFADREPVLPPMYPTRVEVTPGSWRNVASTPQKHPAANVAFSINVWHLRDLYHSGHRVAQGKTFLPLSSAS